MFKNNLAYEASAGSGKTFMLVVRYLSLLFMGAEPSKILALTFTNKAAREMSERVVETLEELDSRDELFEIAKLTEISTKELVMQRDAVLRNFLNAHTKIMTIDSFFTQILRKFSLYASLMPDFTTFASQHESKLLLRFLQEVSVARKKNLLVDLSLESQKRVSDIFLLLDELYVKKEELSSLRFERVSLREMEHEAMDALKGLQNIVSNCKGASASLVKAVSVESFSELLTKTWVLKESLEYWVFKKCFSLEMNQYLHRIQEAIKEYHRAKEQNFFHALFELVSLYEKAKKALYTEDSELSFSDVTALVYQILHRIDDSEFLYFRLDAKIEHMLLDEFQDTSIVQYEILKPLIEEITSGNGIFENGSFFFVGDVKQSIYRFRGGVSALFGEVAKQNNTEVQKLLVNYRSQKEVIEFVNRSFRDYISNYSDQLVREGATGGYVSVVQNDDLLQESYEHVKNFLELGAKSDDIAILCATNGDGEEIKNFLLQKGVDVVTETTTKLINQRSVKALLEYLKYLYFGERIYKENFFALIQQQLSPIAKVDFTQRRLVDVVKDAIEKYGLFAEDFHLIRFLHTLSRYGDIESLLFEYERLDTPAASSDVSGVRVLTIHKSKGLEYKHVIVLDRLKKEPAARGSIIYDYEGISLENLYLRTKGRKEIDPLYERALAKEEKLTREDALNALYVAFTRAKEHLIVIKKSEKSTFDVIHLSPGKWGTLENIEKKEEAPKVYAPLSYKELYYGTQSNILEAESSKEEDLHAIEFGIALHYMLEMMESFSLESIPKAKNMMLNRFGFGLSQEDIADIEHRVELFVTSSEVQGLLSLKYYKEKALRYNNNLRYVDLLIEKEDGSYVVIDYKSAKNFTDEYVKQVRYYVRAIEAITKKPVEGYLCYLLAERVELFRV